MPKFDLYGFPSPDLDKVKENLEKALKVKFDPHESSYLGEYYLCKGTGEEEFQLRKNLDPLDKEPAEQNFPDYPTLLYVTTGRAEEVENMLKQNKVNCKLLRRKNQS